jgi:K+-sensing histidine kinase KdpD
MNFFPTSARERRLLLLFPFKTYVFVAPVCYMVWELATSGHRIRGGREEAMGIVAFGYMVCFLVFVITGLFGIFLRHPNTAMSAAMLAFLAFLFPALIFQNAGMLVATISVIAFGMKFASDRHTFTVLASPQEYPFECPICKAIVPAHLKKCPHCAWSYSE